MIRFSLSTAGLCFAFLVSSSQGWAQEERRHAARVITLPSVEVNLDVFETLRQKERFLNTAVPATYASLPLKEIETASTATVSVSDAPLASTAMAFTPPASPSSTAVALPALSTAVPHEQEVEMAALGQVPAPLAAPAATYGGAPAVPVAGTDRGYVEAGINYHSVSDDFGNWFGQYVRGEYQIFPAHRLSGEILHQREFKDEGAYFAIGDTYIFNEDYYGSLSVGTSTDGFFFPRYRVDAFLYKKWLPKRNLVTSIGIGQYEARDIYRDRSLSLGAAYYFEQPWIAEAGVRFNNSSPGSVDSHSQFIAITQGRANDHFITLRYGFGDESYQVIAPGSPISDFSSDEISLNWRQWLGEDWGFAVRGEYYDNPSYHRLGFNLGFFQEF